MADGDGLTLDLRPDVVRGRGGGQGTVSVRGIDLETLTKELVDQGVQTAEREKQNIHGFVVNNVEKELISQVLASCNYVQTKTAAKLGINRNTLHKKLKDYDLEGLSAEDKNESS